MKKKIFSAIYVIAVIIILFALVTFFDERGMIISPGSDLSYTLPRYFT